MEPAARQVDYVSRREAFSLLDRVMFREVCLNGLNIRFLGVYYMDSGADWTIKPHKHSFYEFHYVVRHSVQTTLNGIEYCVEEGNYYLMPPGTLHSHYHRNATGHIGFALRWELLKEGRDGGSGRELDSYRETKEMADFLSLVPLQILQDRQEQILAHILELLAAAEKDLPDLYLKLALLKLVSDTARCYAASRPSIPPAAENQVRRDNNIVGTAIRFIEENYNRDIEVKDVADSAYLSYSHLARLFKAATGESVNAYINRVRILKAQYLLKCSGLTIAAIAAETGFRSENYFCDAFKKAIGTSPLSYRKSRTRFNE